MTHLSKSDCIAVFYQKITLLSIHNAIGNYKESCPCAATPTQGPVLCIAPGPELALDGPVYRGANLATEASYSYSMGSIDARKGSFNIPLATSWQSMQSFTDESR